MVCDDVPAGEMRPPAIFPKAALAVSEQSNRSATDTGRAGDQIGAARNVDRATVGIAFADPDVTAKLPFEKAAAVMLGGRSLSTLPFSMLHKYRQPAVSVCVL